MIFYIFLIFLIIALVLTILGLSINNFPITILFGMALLVLSLSLLTEKVEYTTGKTIYSLSSSNSSGSNASINSSDYWDNLDVPSDIPESIYWINWNASGYIKDWNISGFIINWSKVISGGGEPLWQGNSTLVVYLADLNTTVNNSIDARVSPQLAFYINNTLLGNILASYMNMSNFSVQLENVSIVRATNTTFLDIYITNRITGYINNTQLVNNLVNYINNTILANNLVNYINGTLLANNLVNYVNTTKFNTIGNWTAGLNNLSKSNCSGTDKMIGIYWHNASIICGTVAGNGGGNPFNQILNTTSNVTFNNITATGNVSATRFLGKVSCTNIDGGSDTDYCTDATGAGGTRVLYQLAKDIQSKNATKWNNTFTMPVLASTNYTWGCDLWTNTSVATTGVQINATIPNAPVISNIAFEHPTTAIAPAYVFCNNRNISCPSYSTASLTTGLPVYINGRLDNGANAGNINITMRSEVSLNLTTVVRGSYCYTIQES